MKNYVFLYFNDGEMGAPTEEGLAAWGQWFGTLGDKLVDAGNPFAGNAKAVTKSGVSDVSGNPSSGYSIVKAENLDDATELGKSCPILEMGNLQIYETMPM